MGLWMKIAWAAMLVGMLVYLYPVAKRWMTEGPKAQKGDWGSAVLPLALVAGFVTLLVMLVR
jgi:hypothetical protein